MTDPGRPQWNQLTFLNGVHTVWEFSKGGVRFFEQIKNPATLPQRGFKTLNRQQA